MPRLLPLFPLNLVVFPGEKLNLHIFEPRYRQLVHDCATEGLTFGIPAFLNGAVQPIGTEMRLIKIEKLYESGESDIRTEGVSVFRLDEMLRQAPGKLYAAGYVETLPDDPAESAPLRQRITAQLEQLYDALGLHPLLLTLPPHFRIFDVAHHLGLSNEQEYHLLELTSETERQEMVCEHLERLLPMLSETERLKERVRQNGHFKNLTPPSF
ncbi:peptidase [Hymenobacter busanensis]|uniref:Peptidase n=1 Tax=Hymenobacter busanensis TaxID=2607656 RepID=A0A7L4ZSY4_9BACT|nr:LON peptidase substrate-binding domain-containing protein [Hymenobacter busanensis]KAA9339792.1 peptidase [Hymenobacter busanensis]QHJ06454.1 peptidase [Hymenobacter busanensis]